MKREDFTQQAPGKLVKTPDGYPAFVPDPLPPKIEPSWEISRALSEADRALGELAGAGRNLPNPHLLITPFLRREAILSSRIEGTIASAEQLVLFEAKASIEPHGQDVLEVANYVRSLEYGLERVKKLPVCLRLFRELHARLMHDVRGKDQRPGEFRNVQNLIGIEGRPFEEARFVPPPVPEMTKNLDDFEKFLGSPSGLPPLIQLALVHYQFEAIHPFRDGNGRIGRLLMTLLLCERKLLPQPLLYLSAYFELHRRDYMDHLLRVSQKGEWLPWIEFFLRGVAEQSQDALKRSHRLLNLWQGYRKRLQATRSSPLALQLVDELFTTPGLSVPQATKLLKAAKRSAQLNVDLLVKQSILKEATGRSRNRFYVAPAILKIIESA